MTAAQERRLVLAALDFAEADRLCREAQKHPTAVSRGTALRWRRLAKRRLLTAAGEDRPQLEIDIRPALRGPSKEKK
jgi:hypothetical protein